MPTICVFGDSIAFGALDYEGGGWVGRLKKYFEADCGALVYNLGIDGDNTDYLLERFDVEAEAREPAVIIFAIGINDASFRKSLKGNKVPISGFKKNLDILSQKAKVFTKKVIFISITKVDESKTAPTPWNTDNFYENKNVKEYNQAIKDFCRKNNLLFIDLFDLLDKEDLEDGLHPNSAGHEKMFQRVKDFLIANKII